MFPVLDCLIKCKKGELNYINPIIKMKLIPNKSRFMCGCFSIQLCPKEFTWGQTIAYSFSALTWIRGFHHTLEKVSQVVFHVQLNEQLLKKNAQWLSMNSMMFLVHWKILCTGGNATCTYCACPTVSTLILLGDPSFRWKGRSVWHDYSDQAHRYSPVDSRTGFLIMAMGL